MGVLSQETHPRESNFATYRSLFANLSGQFIGLVLPIVISPIVLRIIGPSQYGLIGIFNTLLSVTVIFDYGFALVINREIARQSTEGRALLRTIQGSLELLLLAIGLLMTVAALAASGWLVTHWLQVAPEQFQETRECIIIGAAALCLPRVKAFAVAVLNANHRQVEQNVLSLSANLMRYIAGLLSLLFISKTAVVYLIVQLMISIVESILFHIRAWSGTARTPEAPLWSGRYIRSVLPDLCANWGANAAAIVLLTADKLIASGGASIAEYGRYVLVGSVMGVLASTVAMCQQVYLPLMVRQFTADDGQNLLASYRTFSAISAALVIPAAIGTAFFGDHLLMLLMGNNVGSLPYFWTILVMLALGGILSAFTRIAHTMQIAAGRPDVALKFNLVSAFIYPLVLWIGVKHKGLEGAAGVWLAFNIIYFFPFFLVTGYLFPRFPAGPWIWQYLLIPTAISMIVFSIARQLQELQSFILWPSFVLAGGLAAILIAVRDPSIRADVESGFAMIIRRREKA